MAAPALLDTNILVYAISSDRRAATAQRLLADPFIISVQALNEFANVAGKKLGLSWPEVRQAVSDISRLSQRIVAIDETMHQEALMIAERYRLSFYDALMLAAASQAGSAVVFSEDMQHGGSIGGLTIVNPFI